MEFLGNHGTASILPPRLLPALAGVRGAAKPGGVTAATRLELEVSPSSSCFSGALQWPGSHRLPRTEPCSPRKHRHIVLFQARAQS